MWNLVKIQTRLQTVFATRKKLLFDPMLHLWRDFSRRGTAFPIPAISSCSAVPCHHYYFLSNLPVPCNSTVHCRSTAHYHSTVHCHSTPSCQSTVPCHPNGPSHHAVPVLLTVPARLQFTEPRHVPRNPNIPQDPEALLPYRSLTLHSSRSFSRSI